MRAPRPAVRWTTVGILVAGALALLGLVAFWPRGHAPDLGPQPNTYVDATVTRVDQESCQDPEIAAPAPCQVVEADLTSGPNAGDPILFQVLATQFDVPELHEGDEVVLLELPSGPPEFRYQFSDFQRSVPLLWLVAAFVVVVIAFGRWQGVRALAGLAASGFVLVAFVVPALLRDEPALLVALAGTVVIAFVALYLAHGINVGTTVALAGTLISLALTTAGAFLAAAATRLTGLADENAQTLRITADALDLRGLLVAGIVVGALGVLDDVTVSQVSTVAALRRANRDLSAVQLYREAIRVGRDHVASTVNTLVLAYAGASLPLLLFFAQGSQPVHRLVTGEIVSVEIVRMLVGSIGLVLSVPVTTALAAAVLGPDDDVHGHAHGHAHGHPHDHADGHAHGPTPGVELRPAHEDRPGDTYDGGPGAGHGPGPAPGHDPPPGATRRGPVGGGRAPAAGTAPPPERERDPWDAFAPGDWTW
ncbi:MAG TPA: YibE/F family protein [Acidimicrobiales bacterium]